MNADPQFDSFIRSMTYFEVSDSIQELQSHLRKFYSMPKFPLSYNRDSACLHKVVKSLINIRMEAFGHNQYAHSTLIKSITSDPDTIEHSADAITYFAY